MISKFILIPIVLSIVGTLFNSIMTSNVFAAIEPFKNKVNIQTDSTHNNDWNESETGKNNAACVDIDQTTAQDISINGEKKKVNSDLKVDQLQKCDENDAGHNNAKCTNSSINFLDPIDVFFGDNNNINYDIDTKQINDCDDKRNGDNNSECLNDLKNIITSLTLLGDNGDVGWILVLNKSMIAMIILIADNMLKCNNILP
jgi:hypothetical protein